MIDEKLIQEYNELLGDKAPKNLGCKYCIFADLTWSTTFTDGIDGICKRGYFPSYSAINGYDKRYEICSEKK